MGKALIRHRAVSAALAVFMTVIILFSCTAVSGGADSIDAVSGVSNEADSSFSGEESENDTETVIDKDSGSGTALNAAEDENGLSSVGAGSSGLCYVSGISIKEKNDGTEPFDAEDAPGSDSGRHNDIVRSFDQIHYTLEYITALKGKDTVDSARLMIEASLPCTKDTAQFDLDALNWLQDMQIKNDSGVQTITGYKLLKNTTGDVAIPGAGTLSFAVNVYGAKNGQEISPSFKMYLQGAAEEEVKSVKDTTVVSAAPKYNVQIVRNRQCDYYGYFDQEAGTFSQDKMRGNPGRLYGYGIAVSLYNLSENNKDDKKLKGIEIPEGDIHFDIIAKQTADGKNTRESAEGGFSYELWDYKENCTSVLLGNKGKNGRVMTGDNAASGLQYLELPGNSRAADGFNNGSDARYKDIAQSCYDGGTWTVRQDSSDPDVFHVTVSGYKFDTDSWIFPMDGLDNTLKKQFSDNTGYFSVGYLEFVNYFPQKVDTTSDVGFRISDTGFHAVSKSGRIADTQIKTDDDEIYTAVTLYSSGHANTRHQIYGYDSHGYKQNLAATWQEGNAAALAGENVCLEYEARYDGSGYMKHIHHLCKFDPSGLSIISADARPSFQMSSIKSQSILYAAKPDGSTWSDYREMETAVEENLIYFNSLEELQDSGRICIGVLAEADGDIYLSDDYQLYFTDINVQPKENAVNSVYIICSGLRVWRENDSEDPADWESVPYPAEDGAFGMGDESYAVKGSHPEGLRGTYFVQNDGYIPTVYDGSGNMTGGHNGGVESGNSLLIVGYKAGIDKKIEDTGADGGVKKVYDMDAGERTVTFGLYARTGAPALRKLSGSKTDLVITDIIPAALSYEENSSFQGGKPCIPDITENDDGTTTLQYHLDEVPVGEAYDKIIYSCTIGKQGTNKDVRNNQNIINTAQIYGSMDLRGADVRSGNMSSVSFTCIKLSALSLSKSTDTPYAAIGSDFNYKIRFSNTSANEIKNTALYDVLPYNGDGRNTRFSGSYDVKNITLDFTHAAKSFSDYIKGGYSLYFSTDEKVRTSDFAALQTFSGWRELPGKKINSVSKSVEFTGVDADTAAFWFDLSLSGNEYIEAEVTMKGKGGQKEGDVYVNRVYEYAKGQSNEVVSNPASVQIYGNIPVRKVWDDNDNKGDTRPEAIILVLLQNGKEFREPVALESDKTDYLFRNIPLYDDEGNPYVYTVKEEEYGEFYISSVSANAGGGSVKGGDALQGFTVRNKLNSRNLTINKKAVGELADPEKEFMFRIKLTYKGEALSEKKFSLEGYKNDSAVTDENGCLNLCLRSGDSVTVKDIPAGSEYNAEEEKNNGYKQYMADDSEPETGILDNDLTLKFVNERDKASIGKSVDKISWNIGEMQTWTIEAVLPADISGNEDDNFYFRINDRIDSCLKYEGIAGTGSEGLEKNDVFLVSEDGGKQYLAFEKDYKVTVDGQNLKAELLRPGLKKAENAVKKSSKVKLVVRFGTSIVEAAEAARHIPNNVTLEYGGYGDGRPDEKNPEEPYVYTGDISIRKTDASGKNRIEGASFELYKNAECTDPVLKNGMIWHVMSGRDGLAKFHGVEDNTGNVPYYYIKETGTVRGLSLLAEPVRVKVSGGVMVTESGSTLSEMAIRNDKAIAVEAGGPGNTGNGAAAAIIAALFAAALFIRRRHIVI